MRITFNEVTEKKYQDELAIQSIQTIRNGLSIGILLYNLFIFLDYYALPNHFQLAVKLRVFIVTPVLVIVFFLTNKKLFLKHNRIILSIAAQFAGWCIIVMVVIASKDELAYSYYYSGLILVIMWIHLFFRIGYRAITLNAIVIVLGFEFVLIYFQRLPLTDFRSFVSCNFFFLSSNFLGVTASYFIEKSSRTEFKLRLEKEEERKEVLRINYEIELQKDKILQQKNQLAKQYEISSQYETLVNQLKPHFLFNCLNTLSLLVRTEKSKAISFINDFADIYRYILQLRQEDLVALDDELKFVKTYENMQKIRFFDCFFVEYELGDVENFYIPPFTLQLLVENAIKHNEKSKENPLIINISFSQDKSNIIVNHNFKKFENKDESLGIGLKNIEKRYAILLAKEIEIIETVDRYEVQVPVIYEND